VAARDGDVPTRLRARALLRQLDVGCCLRQFAALDLDGERRGAPEPLLEGAVLASHMVRTFAPAASELRRFLEGEAATLRARFVGRSLPTCARLLSERLTGELGFRGAEAARRDMDHVLLDRVIARRVGWPVSLSLVFLLVGRWAGLTVTGVGMPDHFLVRLHGSRPVLVDPFHGGRSITKADCVRHLRSMGYGQVREHLRDLTDRELLAHYLRDLRRAAGRRGCPAALRTLGDALLRLEAGRA
jgi:regulator of sirC expression with transglutaminase-like and TPR domain